LGSSEVVVASLFVGGFILIAVEYKNLGKKEVIDSFEKINYKQALIIGIAQSFSVIPGTSRAAATIIGGMLAGLNRKTAVEFSFILAVPTMLGATMLDLIQSYKNFSTSNLQILAVGFIASFVVAVFAIKFLLKFVKNHTFVSFGIYRIAAAIIFWFFVLR